MSRKIMYDKTNVIIMSKLAVYDAKTGGDDLRRGQYFRQDYIYRQNMWTRFFALVGSLIISLLYIMHTVAVGDRDFFAMFATGEYISELFRIAVFVGVVQVAYTIIGTAINTVNYERSRKRLDGYIALLDELDARKETAPETAPAAVKEYKRDIIEDENEGDDKVRHREADDRALSGLRAAVSPVNAAARDGASLVYRKRGAK